MIMAIKRKQQQQQQQEKKKRLYAIYNKRNTRHRSIAHELISE